MTSTNKLAWGILGTGGIAKTLATAINSSTSGSLVAVASRTQASADAFAKSYSVPKAYEGYQALLNDPAVQAVYISLPNHLHAEWSVKCAQAGKHILCEKPLTTNFPEAMYMLAKVKETNVFFMEAFMYRTHPQIAKAVDLIKSGAIGDVRVINAAFGYNMGPSYGNIRLRQDASGGGILDVGCYAVSAARLFAGAAQNKPFADPTDVRGHALIGATSKVDEYATASLSFSAPTGTILANVACASQCNLTNTVTIFGSTGSIFIPVPWKPAESASITLTQNGKDNQTFTFDTGKSIYVHQVDAVARLISEGKKQADSPAMSIDDTLGNMRTLDQWRKQAGLEYDSEKPDAIKTTYAGTPLQKAPKNDMGYLTIPGCAKPISRVVMGTMIYSPSEIPLTFSMLDYFFEIGGNCLDTAHLYNGGQSEIACGKWMNTRGIREQIVILGKGCHTPNDKPEFITPQLNITLDRLGTTYLDLYALHRDNPKYPVSEFIEPLEEHRKAGRIRAYGGSNWSTARLQEANDYCKSKGYPGFQLSSPNFSLAVWNAPMWAGCLTASDKASRDWYAQHQVPIFSWSSQASGYFAGRITPDIANSPDWYQRDAYRTWHNQENANRLERARKLAKEKNTTPTQIALAYVLNQPFPTFALIGPRTIEETRTSCMGANLKLTPQETNFLIGE
jgi:predicted dehydrogenase/aryl-alcohol dehydrogenase-like predicted oxidoreductase